VRRTTIPSVSLPAVLSLSAALMLVHLVADQIEVRHAQWVLLRYVALVVVVWIAAWRTVRRSGSAWPRTTALTVGLAGGIVGGVFVTARRVGLGRPITITPIVIASCIGAFAVYALVGLGLGWIARIIARQSS
jgi:hypothetical protein